VAHQVLGAAVATQIRVALNWNEELKQRVPARDISSRRPMNDTERKIVVRPWFEELKARVPTQSTSPSIQTNF